MSGLLSREEFNLLTKIHQQVRFDEPVAIVPNTLYDQCVEKGYIVGDVLSEAGYAALAPYKVQRAILVAAGFGSRMSPITINTPKPLVRVHGKRIIESILDAILAAGIEEIYIVRGYLGEQFDQLLHQYPMITFIDNPLYDKGNNILSLRAAGNLIAGSYIFDSDILIKEPRLITPYQYESHYVGLPVEDTDDWCLTSKNGCITSMVRGGKNCHLMFGFSYWTPEDGQALAKDIDEVCGWKGGTDKYWDEVAIDCFSDHYCLHITDCAEGDIVEIDSYEELCMMDPVYKI